MPTRAPSALRDFTKLHREVEAILQHVGLRTWDLLLVDVEGAWVRDEFESEEAAEEACRELGIRLHRGWDDPRIVRRMNGRDHWGSPGGQRRAR
ncbi:MAG: hypothetical protein ACXWXK_00065 [Actinomycetota bacterium]